MAMLCGVSYCRRQAPRLQRTEVSVPAIAYQKCAMCSFFYDSAAFHHDYAVGEANRGQAVRDDQGSPVGRRALQGLNHRSL